MLSATEILRECQDFQNWRNAPDYEDCVANLFWTALKDAQTNPPKSCDQKAIVPARMHLPLPLETRDKFDKEKLRTHLKKYLVAA